MNEAQPSEVRNTGPSQMFSLRLHGLFWLGLALLLAPAAQRTSPRPNFTWSQIALSVILISVSGLLASWIWLHWMRRWRIFDLPRGRQVLAVSGVVFGAAMTWQVIVHQLIHRMVHDWTHETRWAASILVEVLVMGAWMGMVLFIHQWERRKGAETQMLAERLRTEQVYREAEKYRISPELLGRALEQIAAVAGRDPTDAAEMIGDLATVCRQALAPEADAKQVNAKLQSLVERDYERSYVDADRDHR